MLVVEEEKTVFCLQGNGIDRADTAGCNGRGWREGGAYTLNTIDRHAVAYNKQRSDSYLDGKIGSCLAARDYKDAGDLIVTNGKPPRKYIVRRLTPIECCRLQGYPDGWTENLGTDDPTEEEIEFFTEVWARWAEINGVKPKSRAQVIKWLKDPGSDSAEYKAYGNSLAIPCSSDVLGRIAEFAEGEERGTD